MSAIDLRTSSSDKYLCTLSPELLETAKRELNEDPNTRHLEIKTLRERLQNIPEYKGRLDDGFLLRFLRCKKFDQERAFQQVMTFYRMQKDNPDVYDNLTPKKVQALLEASVVNVLKDRLPDGSRVVIFRPGRWDPTKADIGKLLGNNFLMLCKLIEDEETQVCGVTMLADLSEVGWSQAKHISPFFAKRVAGMIQEAIPMRLRGMHYWREPKFFDIVFTIMKQFLKEKLVKRIKMYGSKMENLHAHFPPDILPAEYGGSKPPLADSTEWRDLMLSCEAQFAEECKYGLVDMKLLAKGSKK